MGRTVNELTCVLDASELVEWMAFYRLDPWGGYRTDLAAATVCATMANIKRAPNQTAYAADDFIAYPRMPEFVDHDAISAACKSIFAGLKNRGQKNVNTIKPS